MSSVILIPCKMQWGEIKELHDEGLRHEKTVVRSLWKIIDITGKETSVSFENLIQRIRYVSCRIYEGIESNEKEVRISLLRNGTFKMRIFIAVGSDLEKACRHAKNALEERDFAIEYEGELQGPENSYIGLVPLPRANHTYAITAEAIEEVLGQDTWSFERCFMTRLPSLKEEIEENEEKVQDAHLPVRSKEAGN